MLVATCLLISCGGGEVKPSVSGVGRVMCDESFRNILEQEVEIFEFTYNSASVVPYYVSEKEAYDSLMSGYTDLIVTYRKLTQEQKDYLKSQHRAYRCQQIAVDALAIIVNNENDISELSVDDLSDIFNGRVKTWGEVFPTKLKNDSIAVIFDGSNSGAVHYIRDKFTGGNALPITIYAQDSTEAVFNTVMKHRNAIGIVGVSWIKADLKGSQATAEQRLKDLENNQDPSSISFTDRIKVMPIRAKDQVNGVKPYQAYIYDNSYPLNRPIYAIDASQGGISHNFFVFLTGTIGQKIILQTGIVPASEPVRIVELK